MFMSLFIDRSSVRREVRNPVDNETRLELHEHINKMMLELGKPVALTADGMRLLCNHEMKEEEEFGFTCGLIATNTEIMNLLLELIELRAKQLFLKAYMREERVITMEICDMKDDHHPCLTETVKRIWTDRGFEVTIVNSKLTLQW
jgi:hypothetical protein